MLIQLAYTGSTSCLHSKPESGIDKNPGMKELDFDS